VKSKIFCLALSLLMVLTVFAACSSSEAPAPAAPQTPAEQPAEDAGTAAAEPVEISGVFNLNPEIVLDNNPVVEEIERTLNIKLNIEAPPQNGFWDRVRMLVATGDMPDLVHYGADISAAQWAEEGLLMDVTDVIQNYPNLSSNITMEQYGDCVFLPDGRIYGIPKPN